MRILLILLAVTQPCLALAQSSFPCAPQAENEPLVYLSDFKWGMSLEAMGKKFDFIYASGKRLKGRAYYDEKERAYLVQKNNGTVRLTPEFLRNVRRHIEIALERRYADYVFFPDMGHSHLYIPEAEWPPIQEIPGERVHELYTKMLALPSLKVLYHTAEQLGVKEGERNNGPFPQDKILLWRYFTRNPVGDNTTGENVAPVFAFTNNVYNTVGELKGHASWSAGFSISASKDGCFAYTAPGGKELRFDLSLDDLPAAPEGQGGSDWNLRMLRRRE